MCAIRCVRPALPDAVFLAVDFQRGIHYGCKGDEQTDAAGKERICLKAEKHIDEEVDQSKERSDGNCYLARTDYAEHVDAYKSDGHY